MQQPRIPLSEPDLRGREKELLIKCIDEGWVSSVGPEVRKFEHDIAQLTGRAHAIAVVNGTAALHLALMACDVGHADRVIIPDWTFAATANAVAHCGAQPVLVDVRAVDWALDPVLVDEVLAADPAIRAVIAVDPAGHSADFEALEEICQRHQVPLIEDAAGAIGARYKGRACGARGAMSTFSFNGNKTVTAGGGGMVVADDDAIAQRVRHISTQARSAAGYVHDDIGYNYRMTNVNAAIALAQLERLNAMMESKKSIARRYDAALSSLPGAVAMPRPDHSESSHWLYCCQFASVQDARQFCERMDEHGVDTRPFWQSLSGQKPWRDCTVVSKGVSDHLSGTVVTLPSGSGLTDAQMDRVCRAIEAVSGHQHRGKAR